MIQQQRAEELASMLVNAAIDAGAEQSEAIVFATDPATTRFAGNRIHQNTVYADVTVQVRAVIGGQIGVASSNRVDAEGIAACGASAVEAARRAPADPAFPGLPGAQSIASADRVSASTLAFDADARADAAGALIAPSATTGGVAAGTVARDESITAIANSLGVAVSMPTTSVRATVLSTGAEGGTGWASFSGRDASDLHPAVLGQRAADTAKRHAGEVTLEPGDYTVVLAPEAVADIVNFMSWSGFSAKAVEEGRSFMSGKLGQKVTSEMITIIDDALAPHALGLTFDYEGQPKTRVTLIEKGVAVQPVTDSYWAAVTGRPNTGHALPAPNGQGPLPLDLEMAPGESSAAEMIASVKRGIYVTRFHYVNVEDPSKVTLTGMTRDGTFLIENGEIAAACKDFRFTMPMLEALDTTLAVSAERELVGDEARALVPYLLLERFSFTGHKSSAGA